MRITLDPLTRLSSGLRITVELKDGYVVSAACSGMAYRGLEQMLLNRSPMDAVYLTQRICGMCSASHATAAAGAIESACEATGSVPRDALIVRNLLNGFEWLRSHLEHLYLGFMPDLADPMYGDALNSSDLGNLLWKELKGRYTAFEGEACHDALLCIKAISRAEGMLGGRSPGSPAIVPGGVTSTPTRGDIYALKECIEAATAIVQKRLLGALSIEEWLESTHDGSGDGAFRYLEGLPMDSLSEEKGWGDLPLFMMFCSRMLAKDTLSLPAHIGLDRLGGYPLDDQLIGFLSYGSFYQDRDGYVPAGDERAGSFVMPAGFTSGGLQLLNAADRLDPGLIVEHVYASFYEYGEGRTSEAPASGKTIPAEKADSIGYDGVKYSFIKAPRYGRVPCETGPLARLINGRESLIVGTMQKLAGHRSAGYPLASVYTRTLARMQETLLLCRMLKGWIDGLDAGGRYCVRVTPGPGSAGRGLIEAPRGALGHWLAVGGDGKVSNYQVVAPTTWNASPKCSELKSGPIELALLGGQTTPSGYLPGSEANPVGLYHIVRSFDPCVSCAVHAIRRRFDG